MKIMCRLLAAIALVGLSAGAQEMKGAKTVVPFPAALEDAEIRVQSLRSLCDDSLIIGNGDINALVSSEDGAMAMILTKNDVWDARLETENDPPLPTLARIKELCRAGAEIGVKTPIGQVILPQGAAWSGRDSYHSHAYPCPRACARVVIGTQPSAPRWRAIRAQGELNGWERRANVTVMGIKGKKEASNGYAYGPMGFSTDEYPVLRIRFSGSENARFFVDVMGPAGKVVRGSGWMESPTKTEERTFKLPPGQKIAQIILYTWTEDGALAENRIESVTLEGAQAKQPIDLNIVEYPSSAARLDIRRAVAHVAGAKNGGPPQADLRALAQCNVFLIESPAPVRLLPIESRDLRPAETGEKDGATFIRQTIPGDLDWPGMSFAVALAEGERGKAIAIVTSRESKDVVADAVALARSTARESISDLTKRHEEEWERFWSQSGIEIQDETLQRTWYRSLYFLRCVSKPGALCPGLFASLVNDTPAWHGDYHTNYNVQQIFWGAYPANHAELAEPYDRLIFEYLPRAQWLAKQVFSMQGAYYPHVLFAYEPPNPEACKSRNGRQYIHHVWGMTLGVTGFTVQPVWWHYKYAPDRSFLEQTAYPLVREVALFYTEFVEQCEGAEKAVLAPTVSPEHWGWTKGLERNRNCAFDIAMARFTIAAAIEGAQTLGRDPDLIARFEKALKRLPPYPLSKDQKPVVVDVEDAPPIGYNISVPATPVFPGDVLTWQSPAAERELFARTIEGMKWNGNNATVMLAVSRARLNMPGSQAWLCDEVRARLRPNGTLTLNRLSPHCSYNDFGHYTEQFGAALGVSELLVQSVGDVIRVLPALAQDCRAACVNLRTQGGFLVTAAGRGGAVESLKIVSTCGGHLRLLSPWSALEMRRTGTQVSEPLTPDKDGIVTIPTTARLELEFRAGSPTTRRRA